VVSINDGPGGQVQLYGDVNVYEIDFTQSDGTSDLGHVWAERFWRALGRQRHHATGCIKKGTLIPRD
jgi:hypothetical protein